MEDTLISFETAKLAKEKGFDFIYLINDELTNHSLITQSLLAKWLREVHNIEIAIQWFDNCYIKSVKQKPFKANTYRIEGLDNYEEILELGLQEALKLIK